MIIKIVDSNRLELDSIRYQPELTRLVLEHYLTVQRLAVHLQDQQLVTFREGEDLQRVVDRANSRNTTLTA